MIESILLGCLGFALGMAITAVASSLWQKRVNCQALIWALAICAIAITAVLLDAWGKTAFQIGVAVGCATVIMLTLLLVGIHIYLLKTDSAYRLKAALNRLRRY